MIDRALLTRPEDERHTGEAVQRHAPPLTHDGLRPDDEELVAADGADPTVSGSRDVVPEPDLRGAGVEGGRDAAGVDLDRGDLHLGVMALELTEHLGHEPVDDAGRRSDPDLAGPSPACRGGGSFEGAHRLEHDLGLLKQLRPLRREDRAAARPVEQLEAQAPLQSGQLLAHRRLGQVEPSGGPTEVQLPGHCLEDLQLTMRHAHSKMVSSNSKLILDANRSQP